MATTGLNERAHEHSSATTRGGEYSGSAARGHWNNTRTANNYYDCDGYYQHHTYYREDGGYGNYNSDGEYTGVELDYYGHDSCGYNDYEENDGCYYYTYGGYHCEDEYGGYYNGYVGAETDGYETNYPPTDDDSGPTSREGGQGHREEDEMCCIAEHTSDMATILKEKLKEKEKQMKLAKVTKRMDEVIKAVTHLTKTKQVSPKIVEAIEHLTTEKEEMTGILECPAK